MLGARPQLNHLRAHSTLHATPQKCIQISLSKPLCHASLGGAQCTRCGGCMCRTLFHRLSHARSLMVISRMHSWHEHAAATDMPGWLCRFDMVCPSHCCGSCSRNRSISAHPPHRRIHHIHQRRHRSPSCRLPSHRISRVPVCLEQRPGSE